MNDIKIETLTDFQTSKIKNDLHLISLLTKVGKELGCRVLFHGGYAVDGAIGQITRNHNDIDVQVYSQNPDGEKLIKELLNKTAEVDNQFLNYEFEEKKRTTYSRNFYIKFGVQIADIYFIQVKDDPFSQTKIIIKQDGAQTEPQEFETFTASLYDISFEAQNPSIEAADKIFKREHRGDPKLPKHEQDIYNLHQVVTETEIQDQLGLIMKE